MREALRLGLGLHVALELLAGETDAMLSWVMSSSPLKNLRSPVPLLTSG